VQRTLARRASRGEAAPQSELTVLLEAALVAGVAAAAVEAVVAVAAAGAGAAAGAAGVAAAAEGAGAAAWGITTPA